MALTQQQQQDIVDEHNNTYRAAVGGPALTWSDTLAQTAQAWADNLATAVHTIQHSGQQGVGENIAAASPPGSETVSQMVDQWGAEQADFTPGIFPNVAKDGNWQNVGHYTQVIWRATTQVGCGFATDTNGTWDYLVCQYTPPGNVEGEQVP
jgi:hypothetical protein